MDIRLSDNIRSLRKNRGLTQEALSEALGVTVGAVYKWEAGLSMPEIGMLVKIAELFDVSVDVLLGYKMKDNHREAMAQRLLGYIKAKDRAGLEEAEKALVKFPNDYWIVFDSACMYQGFGLEDKKAEYLIRSNELFERAVQIIPPDVDPRYGELEVRGSIATNYYFLKDTKKAIEQLQKYNQAGVFNSSLGLMKAMEDKDLSESSRYLTQSFLAEIRNMVNTLLGFITIYERNGDAKSLEKISSFGVKFFSSLKKNDSPSYLDKYLCTFYTFQSHSYYRGGEVEKAEEVLKKAKDLAARFDENPDYRVTTCRFVGDPGIGETSAYDALGKTAYDGIDFCVALIESKRFAKLWEKVRNS